MVTPIDPSSWRKVLIGLIASGFIVSLLMLARAQFSRDSFELMLLGWEFYSEGSLPPYGGGISGGGLYPGIASGLLFGAPLFLSEDFRIVGMAIFFTHVLAYWLLDRVLRRALDTRGRVLFCLMYWLSPWRLFFSAHVWNPNWLFVLGALHFWSAYRLRRRPEFWGSFLHITALGLAFQLHGSFQILVTTSVLLVAVGYLKLDRLGALVGAGIQMLCLAPYIAAALRFPEILPLNDEGFIGRGALTVYPVLRGLGYWMRYASLSLGQQMIQLDFTPALGSNVNRLLLPVATFMTQVAHFTVVPTLAANVWLWRKGAAMACVPADLSDRQWIIGVVRWSFVATFATFCLSPTTVMMWQGLIALHLAVLPVVFWLDHLWQRTLRRRIRLLIAGWSVAALTFGLTLASGAPMYRQGGTNPAVVSVATQHPMLDRLGVTRHCTVYIDPENGAASSVLRELRRRMSLKHQKPSTPVASTQ